MAEPSSLIGFDPALIQEPPGSTPIAPGAGSESSWLSRLLSGVKDFATSDTGRGLSGALGVGLLGLHPNQALQADAMKMLMTQVAERNKMQTASKQASSVAQLHAGLMEDIAAGRDAAALTRIKTATSDPAMAAALGSSLSPLIAAGTSVAERMRKSRAYQAGIGAVGSMSKITSPEAVQQFMSAWTSAGGDYEAGHTVLKLEAPFLRGGDKTPVKDSAGNISGWTDKEGKTYSVSPSGDVPAQGPLARAQEKPDLPTYENILKQAPDIQSLLKDQDVPQLVNRWRAGDAQAGQTISRGIQMSQALAAKKHDEGLKVTGDAANLAAATLSGGQYRSYGEVVAAAQAKDPRALALLPKIKSDVETVGLRKMSEADRWKFENAPMSGSTLLIDPATALPVSTATTTAKEARDRKLVAIDDDMQKRGYQGMRRMLTTVVPMLESQLPLMAKNPTGVIKQWAGAIENAWGVPNMATVIKSMQAMKLPIAITFQGGVASQLSDRDTLSAEYMNLALTDSESTARLKVGALKAIAKLNLAAYAGNEAMATEALREYRRATNKVMAAQGRHDLIQLIPVEKK